MLYRRLQSAAIAGILVFGWWSAASAAPDNRRFTGLYVFGDSLSDSAGNLFALTGNVEPPSPPYAEGRFSNGPLWIEVLAGMLDQPLDAGNNRAIGGALTGAGSISILNQIAVFAAEDVKIKPRDLVVVWGGANNYFVDPFSDPADVVRDLEEAVEALHALGAKRFLVPNLPALGDLPLGNPIFGALPPGVNDLLNARTDQHNSALEVVMAELAEDLKVRIVVLDVYSAFAGILANPVAFGFFVTDVPCLVQFPDGTRLPTGVCRPDDAGSFDATGVMFWDLVHPTTAAHAILAAVANAALGPLTRGPRRQLVSGFVREP